MSQDYFVPTLIDSFNILISMYTGQNNITLFITLLPVKEDSPQAQNRPSNVYNMIPPKTIIQVIFISFK